MSSRSRGQQPLSRKSTSMSLRASYLQLPGDREFTFTDYDIEQDEPPKTPLKTREEELRKKYVATYRLMCNRLKINPASFIERNINKKEIKMRSHGLGPDGARALAVALVKNERVKVLDVSENQIGAEGAKAIAQMLETNEHITDIVLSENHVGAEGILAIAKSVTSKDDLKVLSMSGMGICDKTMPPVAHLIENNIYLRELDISHNEISEVGGKLLGRALGYNDTLEFLDVSWNHIRGKGAVAVGKGIQENRGLLKVNLSWNGFGEEGCVALGNAMARNKTLQELNITSCRVHTDAMLHIMKGLQKNNMLETLRVGRNPITPRGAQIILKSAIVMKSEAFRHLDLEEIPVDDEFMDLKSEIAPDKHLHISHGPLMSKRGKHEPKKEGLPYVDPMEYFHTIIAEKGLTAVNEKLEREAQAKEKELRRKILRQRDEKARKDTEEKERVAKMEDGPPLTPPPVHTGEEDEESSQVVTYITKIVDGERVMETVPEETSETPPEREIPEQEPTQSSDQHPGFLEHSSHI